MQGFYLTDAKWVNRESDPWDNAVSYFTGRFKKFFPCVAVVASVLLVMAVVRNGFPVTLAASVEPVLDFFVTIANSSQIMPGDFAGRAGVLWFLSAGLFAGGICVFLASAWGKRANFLFLLGSAAIYNYLIDTFGTLDVWWDSIGSGILPLGLCRAMAGVMLGMVLRDLFNRADGVQFHRFCVCGSRIALPLIVVCCIAFSFFRIVPSRCNVGMVDYGYIIAFCLLLAFASYHENVFHAKVTEYLDRLCLPVYVFQVPALRLGLLVSEGWLGFGVGLLADFAAAALWVALPGWRKGKRSGVRGRKGGALPDAPE